MSRFEHRIHTILVSTKILNLATYSLAHIISNLICVKDYIVTV